MNSFILETVRWRDGAVRILDQTRLPRAEVYLELREVDALIDAIRTLAVRGAPAIGVAGGLGVALAAAGFDGDDPARLRAHVDAGAARIAAARPTAVNLRWACERVRRAAHASGPGAEEIRSRVLAEALAILEEDLALSAAMAEHGAALLPDEGRVITHCNTGGLATAGGGTALGVVLEACRRGRRIFVHVDETRPLLQGARLTAWELARAGIPYAVQCDGAAAWRMHTGSVDAVLVGADRIAANGDTANKVGTLGLALAAQAYGVPFYVVAPRSSFDLTLPDGGAIPIEERDPAEVTDWQGVTWCPPGAPAWNPAFDVTPARLIRGWVTERGVERPPFPPVGKSKG